jgi:FkbM family methyltransferase
MPATTTIQLFDGVKVVVPNSLNLLTPYVLLEQEDWFEDEIKFVRQLLKPGQKVIDIGANVGVYTLPMAGAVGPTGRVWAFEPASSTADMLAEGIAANGFTWVALERSALSSTCGSAQLSLNDLSEMNSLTHGNTPSSPTEWVQLLTLDECLKRHGWKEIDFMKIDAEGEEINILKGGAQFFDALSPLIQYELKVEADKLNMALVEDFAALGYASYRLVPGLGLLAPFSAESTPDGFLLNLFCCKQDRAHQLAAQGLLVEVPPQLSEAKSARQKDLLASVKREDVYGWRQTIAQLPYGLSLAECWSLSAAQGSSTELADALSLYAFSQTPSATALERFDALEASYTLLFDLCMQQASDTRLISLARIAQEYGARTQASEALGLVGDNIIQHKQIDLTEPFLAPGKRFDAIAPGQAIGNWVLAAVLEELEKVNHFSSYYTCGQAHQRLVQIQELGFGSAEMGRRLHLVCNRLALAPVGSA